MNERPRSSRLAAVFVTLGLALAVGGIAFNIWMLRVQELPPLTKALTPERGPSLIRAMSSSLVGVFVLVMAFVLGSFVMVRIGRYFLDRTPPLPPTAHVDVWSSYRLTEAEIEAATCDEDDDRTDEESDDESESPPDGPPPQA
ncbi:MAG: hypothetical protein HZB38_05005 [Planctomycetes bacterium]|nr:hypothetical protein [Planctomycetota bacterium]